MSKQKGRKDNNSGFGRVFNNQELGALISKIHATVISNGSELERIIINKSEQIKDLDEFISKANNWDIEKGVFVCSKKCLKNSSIKIQDQDEKNRKRYIEPDFIIFIVQSRRICKIIELKDGDNFDTKKVLGEKEHLRVFANEFSRKIPFATEFYFCCFNQNDRKAIITGLKNTFEENEILTWKEFCELLNISYEDIQNQRNKDSEENLDYFLKELIKIPNIKEKLEKLLKK